MLDDISLLSFAPAKLLQRRCYGEVRQQFFTGVAPAKQLITA